MSHYLGFRYGLQSAYDKIENKDNDSLYFISDTQRLYKGDILIASTDVAVVNQLPNLENANDGVFYVVKSTDSISIYILNDNKTEFVEIANSKAIENIAGSTMVFTNKTIDADSNTISNLTTDNFKDSSIATELSKENPSNKKLATEKSVVEAISGSGALIDVTYDATVSGDNAEWIFTTIGGTTKKISTPKEVFLQSASYNNSNKTLTLTLNNNKKVDVNLSDLIPQVISTEDVAVPTDKDITVELGVGGSVGGYKTGDTIPAGTTLQQIISKLLAKQVPPTYTQPTIAIANNGGTASGNHEIGTEITPKLKATFTKNDAGNLTDISIKKGTNIVSSGATSPLTAIDTKFTLSTTTSYSASATYAEGAIKNDNLGDPYPTGHIAAGTKTSSSYTFAPYRQGYFYGVLATDSSIPLTSAIIRSGSKKNGAYASVNLPLISASATANRKRIFVACPATNKGVTKVIMPSAMNADCTSDFVKQSSTVNVEGANGYEAIAYNVWVYEPALISDDQTFTVTLG